MSSIVPLPIADGRQTLRSAWQLLRRRPLFLAGTVLVLLVGAAAGLVTPWALGRLVDLIDTGGSDPGDVWVLGTAVLAAALVSALATGVGVVLTARLFETGLAELREAFLDHALALPQSRVERAGAGELVSRASDDVAEVSDAIPFIVPAMTGAVFSIAVTIAGMGVLDGRLALALLIVVPVHVIAVRWYLRVAPGVYAAERAAAAVRAHRVLASLRGLDTVLAYRLSQRRSAAIASASWNAVRWAMRARTVQNMFAGRLNLAEYLGLAAMLTAAFWLVGAGELTLGAATTAVLLLIRVFEPVGLLLALLDDAQSAAASLARIVGIAQSGEGARGDRDPDPSSPGAAPAADRGPLAGAGPVAASRGLLLLRARRGEPGGSAGSRPASPTGFRCEALRIAKGERVALVGLSGAGKTTIASLLAGVHRPQEGRVRSPERTVLLAQDTHVFTGSLAEGLRLARPGAADAELRDALDRVEAGGLLAALPEGVDTRLGHGGHPLTAAQEQQIAFARLILADPELAVLDEATAEADSADADLLDRVALAATEGRAALIVAHRLSQAAVCDRILVMERGRIVEEGTHEQLLAAEGRYCTLWAAWKRGRERDG